MPEPGDSPPQSVVGCEALNLPRDRSLFDAPIEYLEQILVQEEDLEENGNTIHDPLALQAMENSFYEALNHEKDFPAADDQRMGVEGLHKLSNSDGCSSSGRNATRSSVEPSESFKPNELVGSFLRTAFVTNTLSTSISALLYRKGVEEGSKFLPDETLLSVYLQNKDVKQLPPKLKGGSPLEVERNKSECYSSGRRREKSHQSGRKEGKLEKQLAFYNKEDEEMAKMFDRLILESFDDRDSLVEVGSLKLCLAKKRKNKMALVDLEKLLFNCVRAVTTGNLDSVNELLKQIRVHSSAMGDASQRCAHYFANGLEARLTGSQTQYNHAMDFQSLSAAETVRINHAYFCAIPCRKATFDFKMHHISNLVKRTRETLHIIDFGSLYGFHWVELIQDLSGRSGGPPKLRITGIEHPQRIVWQEELVEKAGHHLAEYCKHFNVPFEYNGIIAKNWECIRLEDLKINPKETIAVICTLRFEKLHDEDGVDVDSPRTLILDLIRRINPDIFFHTIANGTYNRLYFTSRFREALHYYSAYFDMLQSVFNTESWERLAIEENYLGRNIMNVVASEGSELVERPETYKQWQARIEKAGFQKLPIDTVFMKALRDMVESAYHWRCMIDDDAGWLLHGWKGRTLYATCCWVPAQQS